MIWPIPVIDLFAGCGGLSEGFSRWKQSGQFPFDVRLYVEKNPQAIRTLELRAFCHQFRGQPLPEDYYHYVSQDINRETFSRNHPAAFDEARNRCYSADLSSPDQEELDDRVKEAVKESDHWVLIGGPPCQAYSTIGRSRIRRQKGHNAAASHQIELYKEYLKVIADYWPAVFVMENVRGLLSASRAGHPVFQDMLNRLQFPAGKAARPGQRYRLYSLTTGRRYAGENDGNPSRPDHFIVKAEDYGIPQARHRIIIFGVRADIPAEPYPLSKGDPVCSRRVLAGLPPVRSGLSRNDGPEEWLNAIKAIRQEYWWDDLERPVRDRINRQLNLLKVPNGDRGSDYLPAAAACEYRPDWYLDEKLPGTLQHQARAHRRDDLWRYLVAACAVQESKGRPFRISDFPAGLRPNHRNLQRNDSRNDFADRFCVVRETGPSRTVVSHIRKDGHYYIHYDPAQCRSLTVREAARLQTFPDNYFFEGNRTEQYEQIGNAVPPLLSYQIAQRVAELLQYPDKQRYG